MTNISICTEKDCGKPSHARGFCQNHYAIWRRRNESIVRARAKNGEPLDWIYQVALPYSRPECLKWPFSAGTNGYGSLHFEGKRYYAHRLVCLLVNGPPQSEQLEAAHSCGNGHQGCVNPAHIRWATSRENNLDKIFHGTHNMGERHPLSKLSEESAREALRLRETVSKKELAERFGVTPRTISRLHIGKTWKHLPRQQIP